MNALAERSFYTRERIAWRRLLLAGFLILPALLLFWPGSTAARAQGGDDPAIDPAVPLSPAAADLKFEHLTTEQGLSSNLAWGVVQDNYGFIWIGTLDGLNRYDGNTFKIFRYDPKDPNSLGDNSVRRLARDGAGNVWIGSWGGGLSKFDPSTEQFTRYKRDPSDPHSLGGNQVFAIHEDQAGALWVGTAAGLDRLDRDTNAFTHYRHDPDDPRSLSHDGVHAVYAEQSGDLWVGTNGGGLNRLDPDTGEFTHYRHDPDDANSLGSDRVASIYQDPSGIVWIGTYDKGLSRFDPESGLFTNYQHDPDDPNSLGSNDIRAIVQDREGVLWFGGGIGGVFQFDRDTGKFVRHQHDANDPGSLSHDGVVAISAQPGGTLWIATAGGGVNRLDPNRKPFALSRHSPTDPGSLSHSDVRSMYVDLTGTLWIGTVLGLNRYNPQAEPGSGSEQFTRYLHDRADPQGLNGVYVMSLVEDHEGALWVGSLEKGLIRFDRDGEDAIDAERFTQYQNDPSDPSSLQPHLVRDLYVDSSGTVWVGTLGGGLSWFDSETEEFHRFQHDPNNPNSLSDDSVLSILEDDSGELWIATVNGINRFVRETEEFVRYLHDPNDPDSLSHSTVLDLFQDREGVLWVGTLGGGLNRFESQDERFVYYTKQDGLPSDMIAGITQDDQGFLWLSTSQGLSKFDPRSETFRNYDASDGLQSNQFNINSVTRSGSGELFFGGVDGFNGFYPTDIKDNPTIPSVVITDFQLANKPVEIGGDSVLKQSIEETDELILSYDDRVLSFEFAALNYSSPEKNRYRYILEGFDEEWTETGSDRRFVTYTNLDPGEYVFRVRGSNNDGVWNEEGASIKITVTPPWWGTWWFRGAAGLLLVGLVTGGFVWQRQAARRRQHQLERLVSERTQELKDAEAQTRTLVESAPLGIGLATQEGEILSANPAMLQITGYLEEEMLGNNVSNLYQHPEQREVLVQQLQRGEPVRNFGVELKHKDGSSFHASLTTSLVSREGQDLLLTVLQDVTEQVRAEQALRESEALEAERAAVDAERSRLARDLHDSATQALYSALLFSETGKKLAEAGSLESASYYQSRVSQVVGQALKEMRLLVFELSPPELERDGLLGALRLRLDTVENRSGVEARLHADDLPPLPGKVSEGLYRIALEALNNTLKHAQADTVTVQLGFEGEVVALAVIDDGQGFDPNAVQNGGLGLTSMQERADSLGADLSIDSAPGQGTRVRVSLEVRGKMENLQ